MPLHLERGLFGSFRQVKRLTPPEGCKNKLELANAILRIRKSGALPSLNNVRVVRQMRDGNIPWVTYNIRSFLGIR